MRHIAAIRPIAAGASRARRPPTPGRNSPRWTPQFDPAGAAVISGASGAPRRRRRNGRSWREIGLPVRAVATALGHSLEPSFPASLALAAMAVQHGALFPPLEAAEEPMTAPLTQALVTSWGHWRGEALALVTAA